MTAVFLAIFVALLVERAFHPLQDYREFHLFRQYVRWMRDQLAADSVWGAAAAILFLVGPPLLVVAIVQGFLGGASESAVAFLFALAVLIFAIGPRNLDYQIERYLDACEHRDGDAAREAALDLLGPRALAADQHRNRALVEAVVCQANDRLFAVIFWFLLLGPFGALGYRLAWLVAHELTAPESADSLLTRAAERVLWVLDWAPSRLVALTYALMGSFEDTLRAWRVYEQECEERPEGGSPPLLSHAGRGSLRLPRDAAPDAAPLGVEAIRSARSLVQRSLITWLAFLGAFTLLYWAS